jgi:hypothetical protein
MNTTKKILCCTALLLGTSAAWAADGDEAESTMRLMDAADANVPQAITREISLPATIAEDAMAVEKAAHGLQTANDSRHRREQGLRQIDEARERGADMANEARDNRENRERTEDRPRPPGPPGR